MFADFAGIKAWSPTPENPNKSLQHCLAKPAANPDPQSLKEAI